MTKNTRKKNREPEVGMGDTAEGTASVGSELGKKISHVIALARSDAFQKKIKGETSKFEWLISGNVDQHMTNQEKLLTRYPDLASARDNLPSREFLVVITQEDFQKDELIEKMNEILGSIGIKLTDETVTDIGLANIGKAGEQKRRFYAVNVRGMDQAGGNSEQGGGENSELMAKVVDEFQKMHDKDPFLREIEIKCAFGNKQKIFKSFGNSSTNGLEDGQTYLSLECPGDEVQGVQMGMIVAAIATKIAEKVEEMGQSQYSENDLIKSKSSGGKPVFSVKVG